MLNRLFKFIKDKVHIYKINKEWNSARSVHKSMVSRCCDRHIVGNYRIFLEKFNSIKWMTANKFEKSLFSIDNDSEIHAGIFKFNKVGFVCEDCLTYSKAMDYIREFMKDKSNLLPELKDVELKLNNEAKKILCR